MSKKHHVYELRYFIDNKMIRLQCYTKVQIGIIAKGKSTRRNTKV